MVGWFFCLLSQKGGGKDKKAIGCSEKYATAQEFRNPEVIGGYVLMLPQLLPEAHVGSHGPWVPEGQSQADHWTREQGPSFIDLLRQAEGCKVGPSPLKLASSFSPPSQNGD